MSALSHKDDKKVTAKGGAWMANGHNGSAVWKWLAGGMGSVILLLVGAFLGDLSASVRYSGLSRQIEDHANSEGHPVMIERVEDMQGSLVRIEDKLLRQSIVLREIEQAVAEVASGRVR